MVFNLISVGSLILTLVLSWLLQKSKYKEHIIRVISIALFAYKLTDYILKNINGNFSIPVEISSISYFLVPIILSFKIKKMYHIGSFLGIASGIGYFAFYTFFGFTLVNQFSIIDILTGCFSHGFLLLAGIHLFKNNSFKSKDSLTIWITMLAIICWGLIFYDIEMRGITFVYYIVKPTFLFIFDALILNVMLLLLYYAILLTAFYFVLKLFFKLNKRYQKNDNSTATHCDTETLLNSEIN